MSNFLLLQDFHDIEPLQIHWQWLQQNSNNVNIFQSYEWIDLWWKHFSNGKSPKFVFAWNDKNPLAVAPFYLETKKILGIPVRRIAVVGDGLATNHEFIFTGNEYSAVHGCFSTLLDSMDQWDYIELKKLPEQSSTRNAMRNIGKETDLHCIEIPYLKYPFLKVRGDFDTFMKHSIKRRIRKSLRNSVNRLHRAGNGQFVHTDEMQWDASFDELLYLGERSWKHRSGVDPLTDKANREFFREIVGRFREKGMLSLTALDLNGKKIAFILSFVMRKKLTAYYAVFDEMLNTLSPGKIIIAHIIERAFSDGLSEIDFSEGEQLFKLHWTKTSRQFREVYLLNRRSPKYPLVHLWLSMRRKIKNSPRLMAQILRAKELSRKNLCRY